MRLLAQHHDSLFAEVAICPNNNEIQVHKRTSSGWKLLETLQEHHMAVMGIDWAPKTNRIVTCSADKNAYVWTQKEDGKWDPAWVLLRINRAATCVKWSPLGMRQQFVGVSLKSFTCTMFT